MKRPKLFLLFTAILLVTGAGSCIDAPEFDLVPNIEYRGNLHYSIKDANNNVYDTIQHIVRFQDGDGDIGVSDMPSNINDYFSEFYLKRRGKFYQVYTSASGSTPIKYHGRIPNVSSDGRVEPLEGDIKYGLKLYRNTTFFYRATNGTFDTRLSKGDTVKFDLYINDRAGNKSNRIESPEMILKFDQ